MANSSSHTAVALGIVSIWPTLGGAVAALFSHVFLDFIPEWYQKGKEKIPVGYIAFEIWLMIALLVIAFRMDNTWLALTFILIANLPDIIDPILFRLRGFRLFFFHQKPRIYNYSFFGQEWQTTGMTIFQTAGWDLGLVCFIYLLLF